jgi:RNA polymerase sigma factor (sigma-70 family)
MAPPTPSDDLTDQGRWSEPTHWSVVLAAGGGDSTKAAEAREWLCRTYWKPIYAYLRRLGKSPPDAEDLTQEFFARMLAARAFAGLDPAKGRFRSFLLAALKHFLANEYDRAMAAKRGGGQPAVLLETQSLEALYAKSLATAPTAEAAYDRQWALSLLSQALAQLRKEAAEAGKLEVFDQLKIFLTGEGAECDYASLAGPLQLSPNAIGVAVHRLRQRFRELIRAQIRRTVAAANEVDEELRYLMTVISR